MRRAHATALLVALTASMGLSLHGNIQAAEILVAAVGDIACDPDAPVVEGQCRDAATAQLVLSRNPDAVLALGDIQYVNGAYTDYIRSYHLTWGRFREITYPVAGNHEYLMQGARGYYEYFGSRAHGPDGYYAFDLNGWRLYAINTECEKVDCTQQREWMRADVRQNRRRCQLMFMHRPLYSSGSHESLDPRRFWAVAHNNKFDLVLAGHDHLYERFEPMDAFGATVPTGIRSFIVGTGGRSLFRAPNTAPGSAVRFFRDYGVLFLTLTPTSYTWEFQTIAGNVIDAGGGQCR